MNIGSLAPIGSNAKIGSAAFGGGETVTKYKITTSGCDAFEIFDTDEYVVKNPITEAEAGQTVYLTYLYPAPTAVSEPEITLKDVGGTISGFMVGSFVMPESDVNITITAGGGGGIPTPPLM